jgi:hypothetical protein
VVGSRGRILDGFIENVWPDCSEHRWLATSDFGIST